MSVFKRISGAFKNGNTKPVVSAPITNPVPQNTVYMTQPTKVVVMTPEQLRLQWEYRMMVGKWIAIGVLIVIVILIIVSAFSKKKEDGDDVEKFAAVGAVDPLAKVKLFFGIFGAIVAVVAFIIIYFSNSGEVKSNKKSI